MLKFIPLVCDAGAASPDEEAEKQLVETRKLLARCYLKLGMLPKHFPYSFSPKFCMRNIEADPKRFVSDPDPTIQVITDLDPTFQVISDPKH